MGLNIIRVKNGTEAIEIVISVSKIDLILMDVKMPVLDGFEATKRIKDIYPDLPVIALTAYSSESDKKIASNIGFADFISKPYSCKVLLESLHRLLNLDSVKLNKWLLALCLMCISIQPMATIKVCHMEYWMRPSK